MARKVLIVHNKTLSVARDFVTVDRSGISLWCWLTQVFYYNLSYWLFWPVNFLDSNFFRSASACHITPPRIMTLVLRIQQNLST